MCSGERYSRAKGLGVLEVRALLFYTGWSDFSDKDISANVHGLLPVFAQMSHPYGYLEEGIPGRGKSSY